MCPSTLCTYIFVPLYVLYDTFFTTTCTTTVCKYSCFYECVHHFCAHLSLFTSSMTPSSPLPAQQQDVSTCVFMHVSIHFMYTFISLYVLHDTFFTTTCTTTGSKYSCFYECVHHFCAYLSLFTSFMTPSSPLPAQQQPVSTLVFMNVSVHFMYTFVSLYVLHDTFFTTICTTTDSKYSCFYECVHHFCAYLSLFTSFMTPSSPLPAQQQPVSILVFMDVSIDFMYTFCLSLHPS